MYEIFDDLFERTGEDAVRHLFTVAASLDSMVVGEPQILAQVKQAYELAKDRQSTGPLTHGVFQAAVRVAKRVATETTLHQRRVSIPSVAVGDFASQIFERFDDKNMLVIGAGEMGEETLRYLQDEGAHDVTVVNRSFERAEQLAERWQGRAEPWEQLPEQLARADLVISTTGAERADRHAGPVRADRSRPATSGRCSFSIWPCRAISSRRSATGWACISIRSTTCRRPARGTAASATRNCPRRSTSSSRKPPASWPTCTIGPRPRSSSGCRKAGSSRKKTSCGGCSTSCPSWTSKARDEIGQAFDRLVNKLLHPPLESLRGEAEKARRTACSTR